MYSSVNVVQYQVKIQKSGSFLIQLTKTIEKIKWNKSHYNSIKNKKYSEINLTKQGQRPVYWHLQNIIEKKLKIQIKGKISWIGRLYCSKVHTTYPK